jgi:uncharacterized membrane protein
LKKTRHDLRPLLTAGFVLGIGLGAFLDGILFHQILQIHNMLSNIIFPDTLIKADINMFWDGLFDAFAWMMTLMGIVLLWGAIKNDKVPRLTKVLVGAAIAGVGTFNLIEGIIDHHILKLHHVVQRAVDPTQLYWDLVFLASGVLLIWIGWYVIRKSMADYTRSLG